MINVYIFGYDKIPKINTITPMNKFIVCIYLLFFNDNLLNTSYVKTQQKGITIKNKISSIGRLNK